ncbi:hypothetical protein [Urbifossiella limnaea]|uniref:HEAT repeat domain-containing protein n=1 Tax=Urbifossiella limnaea TaxID=2528023 RepID=A0A517Y1G9_9BACT|nr:hypothetical protein [Urbifossiella limnaea]QDU23617.1 hypothetical protein ETAA1_56210 [Urbifossiella limnaea]
MLGWFRRYVWRAGRAAGAPVRPVSPGEGSAADDLDTLRAWLGALSTWHSTVIESPPVIGLDPTLIDAEFGRALVAAEEELAARSAEEEADGYTAKYTGSDAAAAGARYVVRNLRVAREAVTRVGLTRPVRQTLDGAPEGATLAALTDPRSSAGLVRATLADLGPRDHGLAPALVRMLSEDDEPCPPFSLMTRHGVAREAIRQIGPASLGPLLASVLDDGVGGRPTAIREAVREFGGEAIEPLLATLHRVQAGGAASDWVADLLVAVDAADRMVVALADRCRASYGAAREWTLARLLRHAGDSTPVGPLLTLGTEHAYQRERAIQLALQEVAGDGPGTAEFLIDALEGPDPAVRKLALVGLYRLGPRGAPALSALRAAAADPDPVVARMVGNAIRAVGHGG